MRVKIYNVNNVQEQWNEVWKVDNIERNMAKLDYPEYWDVFDKYIQKDVKLLEAGCGLGKWMNYFHTRGYDITGIDYSQVAVDELKKYNSDFKVELGDITNIPFKDETFDVYLSFGVLEHLEQDSDLHKAISEIHRVLKKSGIAIITIPYLNFANLKYALNNHKHFRHREKNFFEYNYTIREFLKHFDKKKFEVMELVPENVPLILKRKKKYLAEHIEHQFNTNLNELGLKRAAQIVKMPNNSFTRRQNSHLMMYVLRKK